MRKIVVTFGLIAGALLSIMMLATIPFIDRIGFENSTLVGYTTMVLAFMLVYFGIRSYRDNVGGGTISFGRAVSVGLLITAISSVCYVATWEVLYFKVMPDFGQKYSAHIIARERASGISQQALDATIAEMKKFEVMYRNPFLNSAITFLEPLPVGIVVTLVCAGVLRRQRKPEAEPPLTAVHQPSSHAG